MRKKLAEAGIAVLVFALGAGIVGAMTARERTEADEELVTEPAPLPEITPWLDPGFVRAVEDAEFVAFAEAVTAFEIVSFAAAVDDHKARIAAQSRREAATNASQPIPRQYASQPASVPSGSVWDRLAECESGGNWAIDTGNGYYGGLQFAYSTWTGFGGTEFAARASQATREQQIVVAERVLVSSGWGAWPACSSKLGLR